MAPVGGIFTGFEGYRRRVSLAFLCGRHYAGALQWARGDRERPKDYEDFAKELATLGGSLEECIEPPTPNPVEPSRYFGNFGQIQAQVSGALQAHISWYVGN
ncbi:unnamed protein product [Rhizoctonia solani]|uniref:Uncharacterized protein n=1 Tax=Rhizoctonia solani TaxID=456999 RepID=A0A8H3C0G9_9AGAM|nr:unnamed protein product [Rhizoctonia solani]